ncbi:MAG TPA: CBS domain-containing protein [bacterium]|nr:CBS domain-containing protein [bacterium]
MKIKDWMTPKVVTVTPGTSVKEAFKIMKKNGFRHLPVVVGEKLVGFVTDRDLRRPDIADVFREWNDLYRLSDDLHVEDVMITKVYKVSPDDDLRKTAALVIEKHIGALPVCDGDKMVGIITVFDFLRALVQEK